MEDPNNFLDSEGEEIGNDEDQKLESTKREMGEGREENKGLKFLLERLVNDYQSQQTNFIDILQQDHEAEDATKAKGITITTSHEENELVSLSLGISSKGKPIMDEEKNIIMGEDRNLHKRLALALDLNFYPVAQAHDANESSFVEEGKEEPAEMWPPSKVLKTLKNGDKSEVSQHTQLKKTRVSIRARCDTQTMNDGCQWRKYGQKMAKGNPCPRAYYRCTVSPSCPVRKQVQRCAEDMSILITTYEGSHNHPLPMSATAMASTTSAAASMLQSPSLSSQEGQANSAIASIITSGSACKPNVLNFSTFQTSRPHQFYFPSSFISTLNSHPTITLDLTAHPACSNPRNFTSNFSYIPKFSSTDINFSSAFSPLQSSMPQSPWNNYSGYFNSGTLPQNRNQGGYLSNTGKQPIYMAISQQSLPDPNVAATKAITSNPKFQSALATAFTTCVGNEAAIGGMLKENHVLESGKLNLKLSSGNAS